MLGSTLLSSIFGAMVGFQRRFSGLVGFRFMAGLSNGQSAVSKTYLAELADENTQAWLFAYMSLIWQMGWCLSAVAGGYLSHVERLLPSLENVELIRRYPYALPTAAMAILPSVASTYGYFVMEETLPQQGKWKSRSAASLSWTRDMWHALTIFGGLCYINVSFQACLPLLFYAPVSAGGLGLTTSHIGA